MQTTLKQAKKDVRLFLRNHYSDERLAMLLAHLQSGKFSYFSCCCFVGIPTAEHSLRGELFQGSEYGNHYAVAKGLIGALAAERGAFALGHIGVNIESNDSFDVARNKRLIAIVRAEMWRREKRVAALAAAAPEVAINV